MTKIIDSIFSKVLEGYVTVPIGDKLYIYLDDHRRIELCLVDRRTIDHYDEIRLSLVNKTSGVIHTQCINFRNIFNDMQDQTHSNKLHKHIWDHEGKCDWYGKPTPEDIAAMQKVVLDYIKVWK